MTTPQATYTRQRLLLEELSNAFGPTGHEGPVRAIVRRELTPLADAVETDGIGSLIARIGDESDGKSPESCSPPTWTKLASWSATSRRRDS